FSPVVQLQADPLNEGAALQEVPQTEQLQDFLRPCRAGGRNEKIYFQDTVLQMQAVEIGAHVNLPPPRPFALEPTSGALQDGSDAFRQSILSIRRHGHAIAREPGMSGLAAVDS